MGITNIEQGTRNFEVIEYFWGVHSPLFNHFEIPCSLFDIRYSNRDCYL